jgi:hypothetical protein
MAKTLLKQIEGIDVFIDESGRFSAKINGKDVKKMSLREVVREIYQISKPVVAYEFSRYGSGPNEPRKIEIIRFEGDRPIRKDGGLDDKYSPIYIMSEADLETARVLNKRDDELREEWNKFIDSLPRLTKKNFSEIVSGNS